MPTTSPDNIWFTDDSTTSSLDSITAGIASSVQNALNDRSWRNYTWADTGERTAQTGMTTGSLGRQTDDDTLWQYDGTNWVRLFVSSNSYETLTALNTITGYNGQKATVWGDPNPANNGDYEWDSDDNSWERPYPRIVSGKANVTNSLSITFPAGVFSEIPNVIVSANGGSGVSSITNVYVTSLTVSGFTIGKSGNQSNSNAIAWVAYQMAKGSASNG